MISKESILEGAKKAIAEKLNCSALAVSLSMVTLIHDLLDGDPNYDYCDDDDTFESKLFGKNLIAVENIKDGLIMAVNVALQDELPPEEPEL